MQAVCKKSRKDHVSRQHIAFPKRTTLALPRARPTRPRPQSSGAPSRRPGPPAPHDSSVRRARRTSRGADTPRVHLRPNAMMASSHAVRADALSWRSPPGVVPAAARARPRVARHAGRAPGVTRAFIPNMIPNPASRGRIRASRRPGAPRVAAPEAVAVARFGRRVGRQPAGRHRGGGGEGAGGEAAPGRGDAVVSRGGSDTGDRSVVASDERARGVSSASIATDK